jgi:hypothetical protein
VLMLLPPFPVTMPGSNGPRKSANSRTRAFRQAEWLVRVEYAQFSARRILLRQTDSTQQKMSLPA